MPASAAPRLALGALLLAFGPLSLSTAPPWGPRQAARRLPSPAVVTVFSDWQCPPCATTENNYHPVLAKYGNKVKLVRKDFPLDSKCNPFVAGRLHPASCEAAVAVLLAREQHKEAQLETWLTANGRGLTVDAIKEQVRTLLKVTDFDKAYDAKIEKVRKDIAEANSLGVNAIPAYFINTTRIAGLRGQPVPANEFAVALDQRIK